MKKVKQIVMMLLASLLAQCVWAAELQVVWEGDFKTTTKTDSSNRTYTLSLNDNQIAADDAGSTMTVNQTTPPTITLPTGFGQHVSVIVKYSGYTTPSSTTRTAFLSFHTPADHDVGLAATSTEIAGFWDNNGAAYGKQTMTAPTSGLAVLSYSCSTDNKGTFGYIGTIGEDGVISYSNRMGQNTLRFTDNGNNSYKMDGNTVNLGGSSKSDSHPSMQGIVIEKVAIFTGLFETNTDTVLTGFRWPNEILAGAIQWTGAKDGVLDDNDNWSEPFTAGAKVIFDNNGITKDLQLNNNVEVGDATLLGGNYSISGNDKTLSGESLTIEGGEFAIGKAEGNSVNVQFEDIKVKTGATLKYNNGPTILPKVSLYGGNFSIYDLQGSTDGANGLTVSEIAVANSSTMNGTYANGSKVLNTNVEKLSGAGDLSVSQSNEGYRLVLNDVSEYSGVVSLGDKMSTQATVADNKTLKIKVNANTKTIIKKGNGTLELSGISGGTNKFRDIINVDAGVVKFTQTDTTSWENASTINIVNGAAIDCGGYRQSMGGASIINLAGGTLGGDGDNTAGIDFCGNGVIVATEDSTVSTKIAARNNNKVTLKAASDKVLTVSGELKNAADGHQGRYAFGDSNNTGTIKLTAATSYTRGTEINGGTLWLDVKNGNGANGVIRGTVDINQGGTLKISKNDVTGYGSGDATVRTFNINGGTVHISTTDNQTWQGVTFNFSNGGSITGIDGSRFDMWNTTAINVASGDATISGAKFNIRGTGKPTFTIEDGASLTFNTDVVNSTSGGGNDTLTKAGLGVLSFAANGAYTGKTVVEAGTLKIAGTMSSAITVKEGADVTVNWPTSANRESSMAYNLTVEDGATLTIEAPNGSWGFKIPNTITNNGKLVVKGGSSGHELTAANGATFGGKIEIASGIFQNLGSAGNYMTLDGATVAGNGTLNVNAQSEAIKVLGTSAIASVVTGSGNIVIGNGSNAASLTIADANISGFSGKFKLANGAAKLTCAKLADGKVMSGVEGMEAKYENGAYTLKSIPEPPTPTEDGITPSIPGAQTIEIVDAEGATVEGGVIPLTTGTYTITGKVGETTVGTQTIGVVAAKDAEAGEAPAAVTTAVAVPFKGKTVATLLNTALLNKDDTLMAWVGGKYETWKLDADKNWVAQTTHAQAGDHTAPAAATTALKCGQGVWVTTAGQIVTFGDTAAEGETVALEEGHNLLGNPTMEAYTPEAEVADQAIVGGQRFIMKQVGESKVWKTTKTETVTVGGYEIPKTTEVEGTPSVDVGQGFWFIKK